MEPVYIMTSLGIASTLVAIGSAWGVTKYQVGEMRKKYDAILFAQDGRLNLVPSVDCKGLRKRCSNENEKEHSCQAKKLDELKTMVKETNLKLERFREEQIDFRGEIKVHMELMANFVERHEKQNI